jgi:hypothetical protein
VRAAQLPRQVERLAADHLRGQVVELAHRGGLRPVQGALQAEQGVL